MQLGMIGLGRMGANMVRRLIGGGHECVVFDMSPKAIDLQAKLLRVLEEGQFERVGSSRRLSRLPVVVSAAPAGRPSSWRPGRKPPRGCGSRYSTICAAFSVPQASTYLPRRRSRNQSWSG